MMLPEKLLFKAGALFESRFGFEIIGRVNSYVGPVGLVSHYHYIVVCSCIRRGLVRCSELVVHNAFEHEKKILMYISENNKFYRFEPSRIMTNGYRSDFGCVPMMNFSLRIGCLVEEDALSN